MYDVAVATLAIRAPRKWTENVLSQHSLPDIVSGRQGIARRIPYSALVRLAVVRELHVELGIGVANALAFAEHLLDSGQPAVLAAGHVTVTIDLTAVRRTVDERLATALESSPLRQRGRPPRKAAAS